MMIDQRRNARRSPAGAVAPANPAVDNPLGRRARGGRCRARAGLLAGAVLLARRRSRSVLVARRRTRVAGRRAVGRTLRLLAGLAAVGAVEAAALEHDADRVEELAQPPGALLACRQRVVG